MIDTRKPQKPVPEDLLTKVNRYERIVNALRNAKVDMYPDDAAAREWVEEALLIMEDKLAKASDAYFESIEYEETHPAWGNDAGRTD